MRNRSALAALAAMVAIAAVIGASGPAFGARANSATPTPSPIPSPAVQANAPSEVRDFSVDIAAAKELQRKGKSREALALLAADHKLDPSNRDVTVAFAQTASFAGDQGQAIALLDALLQSSPDDVDARIVLAQAYAFNRDYASAEDQYQRALKSAPTDSDAIVGLAQTYAFEGRYKDAEALYQRVLARDPKNFDALVGRAGAESFSGDYQKARADFQAVLAVQPDNSDALVGLATVEYWLNDLPAAVSLDNRALELSPGDSDAQDLQRQLSIKTSPQITSTLTTAHSSDGSTLDFRLEERFFTAPTTAIGIVQEYYRISSSAGMAQTHKLGMTATYQGSSRFGATLSLLGSKYAGIPSVTDSVFTMFGVNDGFGYGVGISTGGVDGSVLANGGQTSPSQASALVRINSVFANVGYTKRATSIDLTGQSSHYNDGNRFHDFSVDVSHAFQVSEQTSITPDAGIRASGFSVTYNADVDPSAPGYYSYLYERDLTLGTTVNRQLSDRFAMGVVGRIGVRRATVPVYFNPYPPPPMPTFFTEGELPYQSFEPFFDYEGDRFSLAGAWYDDHYRGGIWVLPYQANTIDITFSVRVP